MNVITILFNNLEGRSVQENLYQGHQHIQFLSVTKVEILLCGLI